ASGHDGHLFLVGSGVGVHGTIRYPACGFLPPRRAEGFGPGPSNLGSVRSVRIVLILALAGGLAPAPAVQPRQFVLSPEGNHLWAFDAATRAHQLVVRAQNGSDPGE